MKAYAHGTEVPAERSKAEIERLVRRYGAEGFTSGWDGPRAFVLFKRKGLGVRFLMTMPSPQEKRFVSPSGRRRGEAGANKAWEAECRRAWRALALIIKAKLEAVQSGISTFETEFMAHIVLENGQTMAERFVPQIEELSRSGKPVQLLLPAGGGS